jgi:hypothetical protein
MIDYFTSAGDFIPAASFAPLGHPTSIRYFY